MHTSYMDLKDCAVNIIHTQKGQKAQKKLLQKWQKWQK